MKAKLHSAFLAASLCLASLSFAQGQPSHAAGDDVPFLGVITTSMPADDPAQPGLPQGFGLQIKGVAPESGAAVAGLAENDILVKLDDQLLVNPEQFVALVRSHQPGDRIHLTFIRAGETKTTEAQIGKRKALARGSRPVVEIFTVPTSKVISIGSANMDSALDEIRKTLYPEQHLPTPNASSRPHASDDVSTRFQLLTENGVTVLKVSEAGKELFRGPVDTPEQREHVPSDFRRVLEKMEKIRSENPELYGLPAKKPAG